MTTEDGRTARSARPAGTGAGRRGVVFLLGLAGLGLSPAATAADVPGGSGTKAVLRPGAAGVGGAFERKGDSDWYRVTLEGGRNYAFNVNFSAEDHCARLNLRDLRGNVLRSAAGDGGGDGGFEFRPASTRTLFAEFKDCANFTVSHPTRYGGAVRADARGDTTTAATIAVGQTIDGLVNSGADVDYFRTRLERGKRYTITLDSDQPALQLMDAQDRVVHRNFGGSPAVLAGITVPATGTYYVYVADFDDTGTPYTLSMAAP